MVGTEIGLFVQWVQEPYALKFSEDQIPQLLSAFWLQANLHDNLPSNYEAIAHSYALTLLSSRLMVRLLPLFAVYLLGHIPNFCIFIFVHC